MRPPWYLVILGILGCGRLGFDATASGGDAAAPAGDGAVDAPPDAPPDAMITPGTMTIGFPQVGASQQNTSADRVWVSTFALPQAGTLQRLVAYVGVGGGQPANLRGVVYADSAGTPANLVATTAAIVVPAQSSPTWRSLVIAAPPVLAAGTYWLGVQTDSSVQIAYQVSVGGTKNSLDSFANGPDATFVGGGQTFTMQLSLYGEYAP